MENATAEDLENASAEEFFNMEMENSTTEEFFTIKKNIFQSNSRVADTIITSKEGVNDRNLDKDQSNPGNSISDSYKFLGSYCQYCDFRPTERKPYVLEVHMRTHTGDKPFSCAVCEFSTANKHYLETHLRKHTGEKPFQCPTCQYSATRKQVLQIHLLTHSNEKPFECTECSFKCARKKGLQQHWSFYCKFEHFKCSVCEYKCRILKDLRNHVQTHPATISCPKCDYMGRCKEDLERHDGTHKKRITKNVSEIGQWICSKCGISVKNRQTLRKHISRNGERCK